MYYIYIYIYEFLLCLSKCIFFFPGEKDTTHSMFFDALPAPGHPGVRRGLDFGGYIVWSQHIDAVKYIITVQ